MSDEESGGVRGLRAWAADAAERVRRLVPALGAGAVAPRDFDATVTELDQLERLLGHDPALCSTVSVWPAGALTQRHLAGGGVPADRERAESLLSPGTALGATATEEDRRWAALFLLPLVTHLTVEGLSPVDALWAACIHQGRPGAARPGSRGETEAGTEGGNA
ncbi:hypothetical protein [Streptomyces sp. NPDC101165]|uniref:hypothetical protein n=1 Tax=Streptomyces sp. NPDC101165 TaxID=3366119 RepID=UPI00380DE29B